MRINPFIFASFTFVLLACGNQKERSRSETNETVHEIEEVVMEKSENYRIIGTVVMNEGNCPIYIQATDENKVIRMYPMNLEAKYKVDGMKLKFAYERSRGAQPEECNIDMVISMHDVTLMR